MSVQMYLEILASILARYGFAFEVFAVILVDVQQSASARYWQRQWYRLEQIALKAGHPEWEWSDMRIAHK